MKEYELKESLVINIWEKKQEIKLLAETTVIGFSEYQIIGYRIQKLETEINECNNQLKKY